MLLLDSIPETRLWEKLRPCLLNNYQGLITKRLSQYIYLFPDGQPVHFQQLNTRRLLDQPAILQHQSFQNSLINPSKLLLFSSLEPLLCHIPAQRTLFLLSHLEAVFGGSSLSIFSAIMKITRKTIQFIVKKSLTCEWEASLNLKLG